MTTLPKATGNADPGSLRITYGHAERDPAKQAVRHRRFYEWTENGVKFGSWTWQPGHPPYVPGSGS